MSAGVPGPREPASEDEVQQRFQRIVDGLPSPQQVSGGPCSRPPSRPSSQPPSAAARAGQASAPGSASLPQRSPESLALYAGSLDEVTRGEVQPVGERLRPRSMPPASAALSQGGGWIRDELPSGITAAALQQHDAGVAPPAAVPDMAANRMEAFNSSPLQPPGRPYFPGGPGGPGGFDGAGAGAEAIADPFLGSAAAAEAMKFSHAKDSRAIFALHFPTAFTLFCLSAFLVPIWTLVHLSQDENVRRWLGGGALATAAWLPVLYAVSHVLHHLRGTPVRMAVIFSLCGSSLFLLLVSNASLRDSGSIGAALATQDCFGLVEKQELELQWQEAQSFFAGCAASMASGQNLSKSVVMARARITDCPGYAVEAGKSERGGSWGYLQFLEERYHCSGWCQESEPVWSFGPHQDSCSEAVALVLLTKVRWTSLQVLVYSVAMFGLTSVVLILGTPMLGRYGIVW